MLFEVLEGVDGAEALFDGAAEGHVVDDLVADDAFLIDEEEAAVSDELALDGDVFVFVHDDVAREDVVVLGDGLVDISDEGVADALNAALGAGGVEPGPVGEFGVGGAADDGDVAGFELGEFLLEAVEFGGADEGEVLGVEEEDDVFFAEELVEGEVIDDEFALDGFGGEGRGFFSNEDRHFGRWVS